jgi:hypothetical protein
MRGSRLLHRKQTRDTQTIEAGTVAARLPKRKITA